MYTTILALHSLIRWLVLISLLFAIFRSYSGWFSKKAFSGFDNGVRHWTATIAHLQLILGLCLYFISPIIQYFLHHYKDAVQRQVRFFGMEHSLMMMIAIIIITIGSSIAKRKQTSNEKYRTMAIWFTVALFIILTSIPWEFLPLVSRPYFRAF